MFVCKLYRKGLDVQYLHRIKRDITAATRHGLMIQKVVQNAFKVFEALTQHAMATQRHLQMLQQLVTVLSRRNTQPQIKK